MVTGASSGIGEAFARLLAAAGSDLILVARRGERLETLAGELQAAWACNTEVIAADLIEPDDLSRVEARLREGHPPIDLLVNNAGVGSHGRFAGLAIDGEERLIRLNVLAPVRLTSAALAGMVARGHGAVINISSISGEQPIPGVATYAATKAFLTSFSESLHGELRRQGVTVTAVLPGFTHSEFHDHANMSRSAIPGFAWMNPSEVAASALTAAGAGKAVCIPGGGYRALVALSRHAPRGLVRRVAGIVGTRR